MTKQESIGMLKDLLETKKELFEHYNKEGDKKSANVYLGSMGTLKNVILMLEDERYGEYMKVLWMRNKAKMEELKK